MKKIAIGLTYVVSVLLIVWFLLSWADIVADNTKLNPVHNKYNMFVMMTDSWDKAEEKNDCCGNPLQYTDAIQFGTVSEITDNSVIFETTDGNLYETYVGYPDSFDKDGFYCLFFEGEQITKCFVERW